MRSRNIRRGGVGCQGLLSLSLSLPPLSPSTLSLSRPAPPLPYPMSRSIHIFLPFPLPSSLPLDTCSSRWIRILLGIQVYLRRHSGVKEGSMYSKRSASRTQTALSVPREDTSALSDKISTSTRLVTLLEIGIALPGFARALARGPAIRPMVACARPPAKSKRILRPLPCPPLAGLYARRSRP